jgi:hypothetical protein
MAPVELEIEDRNNFLGTAVPVITGLIDAAGGTYNFTSEGSVISNKRLDAGKLDREMKDSFAGFALRLKYFSMAPLALKLWG